MKARGIVLCAVVALLAAAASWSDVTADFGGSIKNTTGAQSAGSIGLVQKDALAAWFRLDGPRTELLLRAGYTLSVEGGAATHLFDVERLSLATTVTGDGAPLSRFGFSLGRRPVSDHTGYVVNRPLDGFGLTTSYPFATVSASLGTTLLPNKGSAPVVVSRADAVQYADGAALLGSPRLIGLLEVVFPNLLRQQLTLSLAMQEDLRGLIGDDSGIIEEGTTSFDPARGGLVDTQYSSIGLRGNITGGLFYNAFFTLNTGRTLSFVTDTMTPAGAYRYTSILAGVGGVGLNFYAEQALGSVAGLRFVLSTGDTWEERSGVVETSLTASPGLFLPLTGQGLSLVFAPSLGNIAFVEASYSMRPFAGGASDLLAALQFGLTGLVFLRPTAGPISVAIPNTASDSAYLGTEIDLSVAFRPFSDLGIQMSGGVFLPNTTADGPFAGDPASWRVDVSAALSF